MVRFREGFRKKNAANGKLQRASSPWATGGQPRGRPPSLPAAPAYSVAEGAARRSTAARRNAEGLIPKACVKRRVK